MENNEVIKELSYNTFKLMLDVILVNGRNYPSIQKSAQVISDSLEGIGELNSNVLKDLYGLEDRKQLGVDKVAQKYNLTNEEVALILKKSLEFFGTKIDWGKE